MVTMVELQTPGEMDRLLHEAAVLEGITYRQALARTLARAAGRIDDVLLSAAQRRLEELRGKPAPVITEVVL